MSEPLSPEELVELIERVFAPKPDERAIAVLVDLPDEAVPDHDAWRSRRSMAADWVRALARGGHGGLEPSLVLYCNAHTNNGELPEKAWVVPATQLTTAAPPIEHASALPAAELRRFEEILAHHPLVLAPTELSATAPLKLAARRLGFRAATMPGFSEAMIPALRLDYARIHQRCSALATWLDRAIEVRLVFRVDQGEPCTLVLDLRFRTAHVSSGVISAPDTAGNLPSGETYIVPYEGEREGEPSRSSGILPVELDGEVVRYEIERNRVCRVIGDGVVAQREAEQLQREPAYGNLAELGLGVLGDFGIEPTGIVLLDEKLGPHIAFGRSDHFGGSVGPRDFSSPDAVVHIDRVYVPQLQPRVAVDSADLTLDDGRNVPLWRAGGYAIDFEPPA